MAEREEHLKAAQAALQAGDFALGHKLSEELIAANPGDSEALYLAAVAARYVERFDEADKHLAALHRLTPEYGRAWQEEGHLALAKGDASRALDAFARATRFNPVLAASWREQARLLVQMGRNEEALSLIHI